MEDSDDKSVGSKKYETEMEDSDNKSVGSKKYETRRLLLKQSFKNPFFSLVPFDIWRDLIVSNAGSRSMTLLSQTCFAFKEIVDNIGENSLNFAFSLRKEGQIDLALKYLSTCAKNKNPEAMFELGFAYFCSGWGLKDDSRAAVTWFKKSAECGNFAAMAQYANCLREGVGTRKDKKLSKLWAQKVLSSKNSYAVGCCHFWGVGTDLIDNEKALSFFEASLKEGNDLGQEMVAVLFYSGFGTVKDYDKAFKLFLPLAEKGLCYSQFLVAEMYHHGRGCEKNHERAIFWYKKAARQGDADSKKALERIF